MNIFKSKLQYFCLVGKLAGRNTYFACINFLNFFLFSFFSFFYLGEQLSEDPLDRFSQSFHGMKAFWELINDLELFFRYLKESRDVAMATNFVKKMANSPHMSL